MLTPREPCSDETDALYRHRKSMVTSQRRRFERSAVMVTNQNEGRASQAKGSACKRHRGTHDSMRGVRYGAGKQGRAESDRSICGSGLSAWAGEPVEC